MSSLGASSYGFGNYHKQLYLHDLRSTLDKPTPDRNSILDILSKSNDFTYFTYLIYQSGYDKLLASNNSAVTVFAPPDKVFMNLPDNIVRTLDTIDPNALVGFHILPVPVSSQQMKYSQSFLKTVTPFYLKIDGRGFEIQVGPRQTSLTVAPTSSMNATIMNADIRAENGVIHTINSILMPHY
jgi:uncharacterized surface protein with fasciclin (FAS1) repeats